MWAPGALARGEHESFLGQAIQLRGVQLRGAVLGEGGHERVEHLFHHEHFFFADAQQIVVVRGTFDDAARGAIDLSRFIHYHGRVARPGAHGALAHLHGRFDHARAAGHAQHLHILALANRLERFQGGFLHDGYQVLDAQFAVNRFVKHLGRHGGALGGVRMRVEHHGIARRHHADNVAGQSGYRMRGRRDRANHPERRIFFQRDSVIAAHAARIEKLHAGQAAQARQLLDLVIEPANFRFFQFDAAPLGGVAVGERFDDVDDAFAARDAQLRNFVKRRGGGFARFGGVLEHPKMTHDGARTRGRGGGGGRRSGPLGQPAQHLFHHLTNDFFVQRNWIAHISIIPLAILVG